MYASKVNPPVRARSLGLIMMLSLACLSSAHADNKKDQEMVHRLRQQLQQLRQEQQSAQEQMARATQEGTAAQEQLKKSRSELGSIKSSAAVAARRAAALASELDALKAERDALQAKLVDTQAAAVQANTALAQTNQALIERSTGLVQLQSMHQAQGQQLQSCSAHNVELYRLGTDLLQRYENKGMVDTLTTQEPFLQTRRVKLENLVQDYRDQLESQKHSSIAQ
jgi:chromosome segregation ATPase